MRRVLTFVCFVVATFFVSIGVAHANQTKHYSGLYLKNGNGKILSEIDRTTKANNLFQKLTNSADGDQMHVQAPWRDRAPGNGNSVYVRIDWSKNGSYCYLSGIGVSQNGGSVSVSCSNGWNNYGNESKSKHIEDSGWWFFNAGKPFDESSDSIRAAVMTCEDHSFAGDPCSGKRFGGISY